MKLAFPILKRRIRRRDQPLDQRKSVVCLVFLEYTREDICYQIDTLLHRPTADKDKYLGFSVLLQLCPLLSLAPQDWSVGFKIMVYSYIVFIMNLAVRVQISCICGIWIWNSSDLFQSPENRVSGERSR